MKKYVALVCLFVTFFGSAQKNSVTPASKSLINKNQNSNLDVPSIKKNEKASIDLYKIYTLRQDTIFVDTTLHIKREYEFNMLRKDLFGLLPFANEAHTFNTLNFGLNTKSSFPQFGFQAKHFNYLEANDIKYYSVPTPLTELYFKTVMEQGQSLDAFITINTKPNLNFSIAYKGIRSLGKFINNLSSSGNFRFTTSYFSINKRYFLNAHFTGQDILNQENGGITSNADFERSEPPFDERARLDVYLKDAESVLKGNRFFIDHSFKLSKNNFNSLVLTHQMNQEYKFFEYVQQTPGTRFGTSLLNVVNNKTRYNHFYNKVGLAYQTKKYGNLTFFIDSNLYNYFYKTGVQNSLGAAIVPNAINDRIYNMGGSYTYVTNKLTAKILATNSISNQSISNIEAGVSYQFNNNYKFLFEYQKLNSLPNFNYTLYQSNFIDYNWSNQFANEKLNQFKFTTNTKWIHLSAQYKILKDHLYFENETNNISLLKVKPKQFSNSINYLSVQVQKEIKFKKIALDNTILYQSVNQSYDIINVPQIVARNTLYYTDKVFKKAMEIQTGIIFNYFTKYYANDYNPLLAEFYVQNQTKIGNFPMIDFFINAKVRQTRLFLKAEHFNAAWTGYNYYTAPNYPYRDFMVRFGLVWNFFQ